MFLCNDCGSAQKQTGSKTATVHRKRTILYFAPETHLRSCAAAFQHPLDHGRVRAGLHNQLWIKYACINKYILTTRSTVAPPSPRSFMSEAVYKPNRLCHVRHLYLLSFRRCARCLVVPLRKANICYITVSLTKFFFFFSIELYHQAFVK